MGTETNRKKLLINQDAVDVTTWAQQNNVPFVVDNAVGRMSYVTMSMADWLKYACITKPTLVGRPQDKA